jgi:hypothetical protein
MNRWFEGSSGPSMWSQLEPRDTPLLCVQRPGEVMWLPDFWHHATANLVASFGVGGQSELDTVHARSVLLPRIGRSGGAPKIVTTAAFAAPSMGERLELLREAVLLEEFSAPGGSYKAVIFFLRLAIMVLALPTRRIVATSDFRGQGLAEAIWVDPEREIVQVCDFWSRQLDLLEASRRAEAGEIETARIALKCEQVRAAVVAALDRRKETEGDTVGAGRSRG